MELIVGSLLGLLSGLGIGGGSLLLLWLTGVKGIDIEIARCINLLFFFPAALISCLFRFRRLSVSGLILPMILGCASTAAAFLLSREWNPELLRKAFGLLLFIIAIKEIKAQ